MPGKPAAAEGPRRCGFIAIVGAPNAGKSTLVNALVGTKVTIVSPKAQTTRIPIRGIVIAGAAQLVLVDTPGIFAPRRRLDRAMVDAAWGRAGEADIIAVLVDAARGLDEPAAAILERLKGAGRPLVLVLNKVDRVEYKEKLLKLATEINTRAHFTATFMISALSGSGIADLTRHLAAVVPEGPWHFPDDEVSDAPERLLAAELTREKLYHHLHDELPYAATVETTGWTDKKDGSVRIEQTIYVTREGHKGIVLGKDGRLVKKISMEARTELGQLIGRTVHLFLFVKVRERWQDDPERYREMGLDFPKEK